MTSLDARFASVVDDKFRSLREPTSDYLARIGGREQIGYPGGALLIWHELFEAMLLFRLGVQLECLSEETARDHDWLNFSFFSPVPIVYIPSFWVLSRSFPNFPEMQKGFQVVRPLNIENKDAFRPAFEKILLLELQMLQDFGIRTFLECVKYWPEDYWRKVREQTPRPEEVVDSAESTERTAAVVLYGFLRSLGSCSEVQGLLKSKNLEKFSSDATRFDEHVREIFNWRIDFASGEARHRFEALRAQVVSSAVSEVPVTNRAKLQGALDSIIDDVFGLTE